MRKSENQEVAPRRKNHGGLRRWFGNGDRPFDLFSRDRDGFHQALDRLFDEFWQGNAGQPSLLEPWMAGDLYPSVDQTEDDKTYYVKAELPGMDEADVDVSFADGLLTISGEKKQEKEEKEKDYYRSERSFGAFRRVLSFPGAVDESKIQASFKKGVLSINLPKTKEAQAKVRKIPVKGG
jgi:HSP20 family protein